MPLGDLWTSSEIVMDRALLSAILDEEVLLIEKIHGGMTNVNYKLTTTRNSYIYRVPGNASNLLVSRQEEMSVLVKINDIDIDVRTVYFDVLTGMKITEYVNNQFTTVSDSLMKIGTYCSLLNRLHSSGLFFEHSFSMFQKLEFYESLMEEEHILPPLDYTGFRKQLVMLDVYLNRIHEIRLSPCHNDPVCENILQDEVGRSYLIDWEYAGMNDPFWDLAAVCQENDFDEQTEVFFLTYYFKRAPTITERKVILIYKIYQDALWSIWAFIKSHFGDDYMAYGINRYKRARRMAALIQME